MVREFSVIDLFERIDLRLQLLEGVSDGLLVEEAKWGLGEPFVLALRRWFIWFPDNRLDAEPGDELSDGGSRGQVQRRPLVPEQPLRNPVCLNAFSDDDDGAFGRFTPSNMGRDREAEAVSLCLARRLRSRSAEAESRCH